MRLARAITLPSPGYAFTPWLGQLILRLAEADARYRAACRLQDLPEERLRDMGLPGGRAADLRAALRGDWS